MENLGEYEYNKKDLIGHGAFAVVFKGRNRKRPDKAVAIKSITKKNIAKSQQLLSKEIKILKELSDLHHENVVGLMDCKETTNHVYLVMEYCNGGDLADYLQAKGTLSEDTISLFLRQIAAAMKALNAKGIVHRDLKPQNILLCYPGRASQSTTKDIKLKIADFGFARFLQDGVMAATLCGSPMYMAPEVIMSLQYDAKADLWSIGTIVFQCLTGKAPFQAQTPQQLKQFYEKHSDLMPNIPSGTSPELRDLLLKLLKRNSKDRIEFENFFRHAFLQRSAPKPTSKSAPVPVPHRSASFSSEGSTPKHATSATPPAAHMEYTPPHSHSAVKPDVLPQPSPPDDAGFLKVDKEEMDVRKSPTEDFVLVPEGDHIDVPVSAAPIASEEDMDTLGDAPPSMKTVAVHAQVGTATYKKEAQTSPSRPSTLPVNSPPSPPSSNPIPVPTQARAYQKMQQTSPTSPLARRVPSSAEMKQECVEKEVVLSRQSSETKLCTGPGIVSLSPPSGLASPRFSPLPFGGGPGSLPTILGSPTKLAAFNLVPSPEMMPLEPVHAPFGKFRPNTYPESIAAIAASPEANRLEYPRSDSDPCSLARGGTSLLSQQLLKAAFGTQTGAGQMITYSGRTGSRERLNSGGSDKTGSMERERSSSYFRRSSNYNMETSPPASGLYAQSPPNMEGPITFVAPELSEETLMDEQHNEIMAKLSFVLDLVECIMELAQARGAALSTFNDSVSCKQGESLPAEQLPRFTEAQRRLEQLVLFVRSLHLLSSALQLSRQEIKSGRLHSSNALKAVLKQMNDYYHRCVLECRQLHQRLGTTCKTPLTPQLVVATADKLIYNYAIEMCQGAALDELFGNPKECFRRYTVAQILLHSLAQQAPNSRDKDLLNKYKESVERRLSNLQSQGVMNPYDAYS
ncbi:serine/threonine-protein kinase unc-51-like isoform X3 [Haliotis rufescens]|uniref:serine/threonine-protein kinase unc-51-like isoform X3 n=1 Tax=Haliotis rufescens TaxID=6454 RepID=UPI001EB09015|nr:serine/threonine-protein kinase unc-51-like isoform X3 [Haliotis rufescens]